MENNLSKIRLHDCLFWIFLSQHWKKWKDALIFVKPENFIFIFLYHFYRGQPLYKININF